MNDDDEDDFDKALKLGQNGEIMENIANVVDMLNNSSKSTDEKHDEMIRKLENPKDVKKSFETKIENDDDDEIFIVHEEEDDNQDSLFAEGAFQSFNEEDVVDPQPAQPTMEKKASSESTENPFKDNLANSEALPLTQKLDVKIEENYIGQFNNIEGDKEIEDTKNMHMENKQKRKNNRNKT